MTNRLEARLRQAALGVLSDGDSHKKIHQDAFTALKRQKERIRRLEDFAFFIRGWLKDNALPENWVGPLRKRMLGLESDLKRSADKGGRPPCQQIRSRRTG